MDKEAVENRIPIIKINGNTRFVNNKDSKWSEEIRNKTLEEYQRMLYIELPELINRIVNTAAIPVPVFPELIETALREIEVISKEECRAISEKYRRYLNSPNDKASGENS